MRSSYWLPNMWFAPNTFILLSPFATGLSHTIFRCCEALENLQPKHQQRWATETNYIQQTNVYTIRYESSFVWMNSFICIIAIVFYAKIKGIHNFCWLTWTKSHIVYQQRWFKLKNIPVLNITWNKLKYTSYDYQELPCVTKLLLFCRRRSLAMSY